jgi:hypothetical protein
LIFDLSGFCLPRKSGEPILEMGVYED